MLDFFCFWINSSTKYRLHAIDESNSKIFNYIFKYFATFQHLQFEKCLKSRRFEFSRIQIFEEWSQAITFNYPYCLDSASFATTAISTPSSSYLCVYLSFQGHHSNQSIIIEYSRLSYCVSLWWCSIRKIISNC